MDVIKNNFGTYHYHPCKNKSKGAIVFIHGFATQSLYHDGYFADQATQNYDYYALQLPGHGIQEYKSDSKITVNFFTKYCVDLIKSIGLKKFYLIGHSMGGGIGIRVANKLKNEVLAYVAVTPMNSKISIKCIRNYWKFTPKNFKKTLNLNIKLYRDLYETKNDEDINQYIENEMKYQVKYRDFFKKLKRNMFSLKNKKNCRKNEKKLSVPTLAIAGKHDKIIPYKSVYKMFGLNTNKKKKENVSFELFNQSAHLPFQEENERYNKSVLNFFDRISKK